MNVETLTQCVYGFFTGLYRDAVVDDASDAFCENCQFQQKGPITNNSLESSTVRCTPTIGSYTAAYRAGQSTPRGVIVSDADLRTLEMLSRW
ncbi:MAG: hypothetical protein ACMXYK_00470 [Candidatus Woesearchaeota archaeon]